MAKILCAYSGIEFTCEHFPITLHARESYHPIFNIPQKKLFSYLAKWSSGELTPTDSYLLFLAILKSTDHVIFNVPCAPNPFMASIVATNMERLVKITLRMNTVAYPNVFSNIAITPDTKFLSNVAVWIENWEVNYADFQENYKSAHESQKLIQREHALERLIKNPYKSPAQIAPQLAEWASQAGSFPIGLVPHPFNKRSVPLADYWKELIGMAAREERLYTIPKADLEELLEHCESNIPVGSGIFSHTLFKLLRNAVEKQKNFLGLGDYDVKPGYNIIDESTTVQDANIAALIQSAPEHLPKLEDYPSKFDYMKAKFRWDMAVKAGARSNPDSKE